MANSVFYGPFGFINNGSSIIFPLPAAFPDGTAAAPSITFANDTVTGFYRPSASHIVGFVSNANVPALAFSNTGAILSASGTVAWTNNTIIDTPDVVLAREAANTLALRNGTAAQQFNVGPAGNLISLIGSVAAAASYIEGIEGTAPAAGAVNTGRIFFQDNGGGKTQLMVIFNSGAAQQIAIQP